MAQRIEPGENTFESWGPLRTEWCEPVPQLVKFAPDPALFRGRRLIVRRTVRSPFRPTRSSAVGASRFPAHHVRHPA